MFSNASAKVHKQLTSYSPAQAIQQGGWVLVALLITLALTACTSPAFTGGPGDNNGDGNTLEGQPLPVVDQGGGSSPSANGEAGYQFSALEADAIVAAQEQVFTGIYERVVPSVVQIRVVQRVGRTSNVPRFPDIPGFPFEFDPAPRDRQSPEDFFRRGGGSGFVWDDQGHIVTNHHVVAGADRITVTFYDRTEMEAELLGSDPDSDLAVLRVDVNQSSNRPAELGDSSSLRVGQLAVAIGNPFGQDFTITSGIISALGRTIRSGNSQFSIPRVVQTDAPINPGNSGGPLLDRQGRVIGVNTQIITESGFSSGIGFAVPIDTAKRVVPALIETGEYEYAWLGISGTSLTPDAAELMGLPRDTRGALVIDLSPNGPAAEAGLRKSEVTQRQEGIEYQLGGDVIVSVNGESITDMDQLVTYLIENTVPGEVIQVEVIRGGETRETVEVTLGKRPGA
jgi:serine protease Do